MESKRALLIIMLIASIIYVSSLNSNLDVSGDNGFFLSLAKSLAVNKSYSFYHDPAVQPETHWPILFPLLLSPIVYFFNYNILLLEIIPLIFGILSIPLTYLLIKQYNKKLALIATAIVAFNPFLLIFSHSILSETTYLFFSLLTLYSIKEYSDKKTTINAFLFLASISLLLTYFTRDIAIALIISTIVFLAHNHKFKKLFLILILIAIPVSIWLIRTLKYYNQSRLMSSFGNFFLLDVEKPYLGTITIATFISRVLDNICNYLGYVFIRDATRMTDWNISILLPILIICGIIFWFITFVGFIMNYRKNKSILEYYFIIYLLFVVVWPWNSIRFFIPLLPLLVYYFTTGLNHALVKLLSKNNAKKAFTIIIALIIVFSLVACSLEIKRQHAQPYYTEDWLDYYNANIWIKEHTPEDSLILARKCSLTHVWSERKCIGYPYETEMMLNYIKDYNLDYVIADSFKWTDTTKDFLIPFIQNNPYLFKEVHKENNTTIYRINHAQ